MYQKSPELPYSEKRLESYAKWYYERYFPSIEALREKLLKKCDSDDKKVDSTLTKIREMFIEELLIDQRVRMLIDSHKNERFIRQNLMRKKFNPEIIEKKIEEYRDDLISWEAHRWTIEKKWTELWKKWKSEKIIIQTLCIKFPHFKEEIHSLWFQNNEKEEENLKNIYEKLCAKNPPKTHQDRQKIAAKLMQRGFEYSKIKIVISE